MRFYFRDRSEHLASHLPDFETKPLSIGTAAGLPETVLCVRVSMAQRDLRQCDVGFLVRYDVFPATILKFYGEWQRDGREMRAGDTIVQQVQIPPRWGFHLLFGVRVLSVEHSAGRASFSYGTLLGHPEVGINAFSFASTSEGVEAAVRTKARPGLWLSRLLAPVFTHPYVLWCNRRALDHLRLRFTEANP